MAISAIAAAAVVGTGYSIVAGQQAADAQSEAMAQQQAQFEAAQKAQQEAQAAQLAQSQKALDDQKAAYDAQIKAYQESLAQQKTQSDALLKQSEQQAAAQQSALGAQLKQSQQAFNLQTEQINRANQKKPDTAAIISSAKQSAAGGQSGTLLTGPQGIDTSQLTLGRTSLLGG